MNVLGIIPGIPDAPLWVTAAASAIYALCKRIPILSQPWRVVTKGGDQSITLYLVRRLRFAQLGFTYVGAENRVKIGNLRLDDPDFDEKFVEMKFKAEETARRLEGLR